LRETASYEPSCVKISLVVFSCRGRQEKKGRKGKGRHKKSRKRYISPIRGGAPRKRIFTKFCTSGGMLDIIICANFGVEKVRGLGNTRGQILEFPIEMAGHPYNSAALPRSLCKSWLVQSRPTMEGTPLVFCTTFFLTVNCNTLIIVLLSGAHGRLKLSSIKFSGYPMV